MTSASRAPLPCPGPAIRCPERVPSHPATVHHVPHSPSRSHPDLNWGMVVLQTCASAGSTERTYQVARRNANMENDEKRSETAEPAGGCPGRVPAGDRTRTETMRRALMPMPSPERINFVMQRVYDRRKRFLYAHQVASALCDTEQLDLVCELLGVTSEHLLAALGAPPRSDGFGYIVKVNGIDVRCDTAADALALANLAAVTTPVATDRPDAATPAETSS